MATKKRITLEFRDDSEGTVFILYAYKKKDQTTDEIIQEALQKVPKFLHETIKEIVFKHHENNALFDKNHSPRKLPGTS